MSVLFITLLVGLEWHILRAVRDSSEDSSKEQSGHTQSLINESAAYKLQEQSGHTQSFINESAAYKSQDQRSHKDSLIQENVGHASQDHRKAERSLIQGKAAQTSQVSQKTTGMFSISIAAAAAEFVAMMLFIIIGAGSAMGVATEPAWILQVSFAFGIAITSLAFAVGKYSGGQMNCAVTLGLVLTGNLGIIQGCLNLAAQLGGAVCGAFILTQMHHEKDDKTGSLACNSINDSHSVEQALIGEVMMTALLMFVVLETATGAAASGPASHLAPIPIGFAVFLAHIVLIPIDGCSINPTRSFGTAFVASRVYMQNCENVWKDMWVFWAGPCAGAVLASVVHIALHMLGG